MFVSVKTLRIYFKNLWNGKPFMYLKMSQTWLLRINHFSLARRIVWWNLALPVRIYDQMAKYIVGSMRWGKTNKNEI